MLSDSARSEISKKVMDNLRAYHISNWHSEPYQQNQNPAEWQYRTIKSWTNTVMNRSGAPANCWLLCMIYVYYNLNLIACGALNGSIPLLVYMELPLIFPLCCNIHFINLYFMLHMTNTFHQKVKKGQLFG